MAVGIVTVGGGRLELRLGGRGGWAGEPSD